jgi:hypothetical protein
MRRRRRLPFAHVHSLRRRGGAAHARVAEPTQHGHPADAQEPACGSDPAVLQCTRLHQWCDDDARVARARH